MNKFLIFYTTGYIYKRFSFTTKIHFNFIYFVIIIQDSQSSITLTSLFYRSCGYCFFALRISRKCSTWLATLGTFRSVLHNNVVISELVGNRRVVTIGLSIALGSPWSDHVLQIYHTQIYGKPQDVSCGGKTRCVCNND